MINFNGTLQDNSSNLLSIDNRGYAYGDALFETIKVLNGKILFWEDHYFRLMASMRILRMEIPMNFTMEFLQDEIIKILEANNETGNSVRVKLLVNRVVGGKYLPVSNNIDYVITTEVLPTDLYQITDSSYIIDLYKDFFIAPGLLSTLKTNNKITNVLGSIYAKENGFDNCLLLNTNKNIIEALNGNIFVVKDNVIKTPPLEDGCLKGIMRKQVIELLKANDEFEFVEDSVSPFELQKADELFITNVIVGILPITNYRKKEFSSEVSKSLLQKLNIKIRLT
ncbi:aminotransferase class IV [Aquaticitalea lipolytica]|uniref:branched-chain-amino-acid transaminase n=1 Tax=Aquaticitalea lipolytica TaxID=1247562 RepID=A0A8J2TS78_9FLAO|nr:aminotransferase class IV [Aquaticitalea lipolytica]GFZ76799.1 aminotransferase class IV [Aquaticitalea lipolytica]